MRSRVLMGTRPSVPGTRDHVRQYMVGGRMRSRVTVIAVPIARLTFERHLVGDLERLTQRQNYFGGLILQR